MTPNYKIIKHKKAFNPDLWAIEIVDGPYVGLVYQYDKIEVPDVMDDPEAEYLIGFNYVVVDNPRKYDLTSDEIKDIMGNILVNTIQSVLEANLGKTNPKESTDQ